MMLKSNTAVQSAATGRARTTTKARAAWRNDWPLTIALVILGPITYVPFVSVLINSVKDDRQFFTQFWLPTTPFHFENYQKAWPIISQSILNSVVYSTPTVLLVLVVSGLTGYAFARYRFWGREAIFFLMLLLTFLPGILLVIPMFVEIKDFGWINTTQGIV